MSEKSEQRCGALASQLRDVIAFASTAQLRNTDEWMRMFAKLLNQSCIALGDGMRLDFNGERFVLRAQDGPRSEEAE